MLKLSKPSLHIKFPKFISKTVLLLLVGALVFFGILAYGMVRSVQAQHVKEQEQAAAKVQADKVAAAHQAEVKNLESELTAANAGKVQACDYLKTLAAAKTTAKLVVVPAGCKL